MKSNYVTINKEDIRQLSQRSDLWGFWLTFHVWAVIIAAGAMFVVFPSILTFIAAVLIIGTRQHGMAK